MTKKHREFYDENRNRLFSYLLKMSGNQALAEDLVQESFVRHFQRYRDHASPLAFLYTIARHVFFDHLRRQKKMVPISESMALSRQNVEQDLLLKEEYRRVIEALQQLPSVDREILSLLADKGLSYAAIGKILSLSEANVKVRVHRARTKLLQILNHDKKP